MDEVFAKCHVGLRGQRYTPGERMPRPTDEELKRLIEEDAVEIISCEEYEEKPAASAPCKDDAEADAPEETDEPDGMDPAEGADDAEEQAAEMPIIDATDGIVDAPQEKKPEKGMKARKA